MLLSVERGEAGREVDPAGDVLGLLPRVPLVLGLHLHGPAQQGRPVYLEVLHVPLLATAASQRPRSARAESLLCGRRPRTWSPCAVQGGCHPVSLVCGQLAQSRQAVSLSRVTNAVTNPCVAGCGSLCPSAAALAEGDSSSRLEGPGRTALSGSPGSS